MAGEKVITVGDLEIEAIERVVVRVEDVWGGIVGVALKEPVAVIIRSPAGTRRVDLEHLEGTHLSGVATNVVE